MTYLRTTFLMTTLLIASCATTPDPAEVCTAQWIKPRSERAVKEIKRDVSSSLRTISSAAKSMSSDNAIVSAVGTARLSNAVKGLGNKFETSTALKDLKVLGSTCDDPQIIKDGLTQVVESSGIPQNIIDMFNGFQSFIDQQADITPEPPQL